jgi:hypothetical protein
MIPMRGPKTARETVTRCSVTMKSSLDRNALDALFAGALGTLALNGFERLEWLVLGRVSIYAPRSIARHLAAMWLATPISPRVARRLGTVLRCIYGPSLGLLIDRMESRRRWSTLGTGLVTGLGIYAFELIAMPHVRATPPLRRWSAGETLLLLAHTTVFGIATSALLHCRSGESHTR